MKIEYLNFPTSENNYPTSAKTELVLKLVANWFFTYRSAKIFEFELK